MSSAVGASQVLQPLIYGESEVGNFAFLQDMAAGNVSMHSLNFSMLGDDNIDGTGSPSVSMAGACPNLCLFHR